MSNIKPSLKLDVIFVPSLLSVIDLTLTPCAVIDILRATTTITTALASGAKAVIPCMNASEAIRYTSSLEAGSYLLGGEERSLKIPGFHLGNSPLEYLEPQVIGGKTIFFATTNGTPTLRTTHIKSQLPVYIASLLNLTAVSSRLMKQVEESALARVALVCSGSYGTMAQEDVYSAGLMVKKIASLASQKNIALDLYDGAQIARDFASLNEGKALEVLRSSKHGRNLESTGFAPDLAFAAQIDRYDITPVFSGESITRQE